MADFYSMVPKDLATNLAYRIDLRRRAAADREFRKAVKIACREDFLFFLNAIAWVYEPRPKIVDGAKLPHMLPFITWGHQDPAIRIIKEHLGYEDIGIEKSRGEGASWICVLLAFHDWLFDPLSSIGLVSRNEDSVDNPDDPDSLFWKLDWELEKLPFWLRPRFNRNKQDHTLRNLDNGATITGYPATGDVASGGRKKWFLMDELAKFPRGPDAEAMASTQYVTNSRLVPSTPKGASGAYYDLMHQPSSMIKVSLSWEDNPTRNRGLYRFVDGAPLAVDPLNNQLPVGYAEQSRDIFSRLRHKGFKLEGKLRSPWYDHECDRPGATPHNIAQELDRDYGGSMYRVFGADFFERARKTMRQPYLRGALTFTEELAPSWDSSDDGPMLLWAPLDNQGQPMPHQYVAGCDVGTGLGGSYTSNSVVTVYDIVTMEQVFEYACNTVAPTDFADLSIAVAKWFHDAYLVWEANGPGAGFTYRVKSRRYANCFMRPLPSRRGRKKTRDLGWWSDDRTKPMAFGEFSRSARTGEITLRSDMMIKECGQYVVTGSNGQIMHILSANTKDDSSRGQAHGDRVIASVVCLQGIRDRPLLQCRPGEDDGGDRDNPPPGTMAERQRQYEDSQRESDGWDDRSTSDMMGLAGRFDSHERDF